VDESNRGPGSGARPPESDLLFLAERNRSTTTAVQSPAVRPWRPTANAGFWPWAPLPRVAGGFCSVSADPGWPHRSNSVDRPGRNARRHYHCPTLEEIAALPVGEVVADNAVLWLWVPGPFLVIGAHIPIMRAWGFKPTASGFVWIKTNRDGSIFTGTGHTTRKNAEFCVLGKRGKSVRRAADVHEVILAPRREHSRKPDEFYRRAERYSGGPYLDLFPREKRVGWVAYGDEISKFSSGRTP
jgi:N6-adenosine-specific RNA methylase IME4